jgi:NADP-dependent 3-hydroxy acid dehydrogenase YdfG
MILGDFVMRFDGTRVLITGGGSGIGLATARAFLAEGAKVAIAGRDADKLHRAAAELKNDRLLAKAADATNPAQVDALVMETISKFGGIDILVNNAGANIPERSIQQLTPESFDKLIRANLHSAFHCIWAVLPGMVAQKNGLVINISSVAGVRPWPVSGSGYCAAKFAMNALGSCISVEERENGIRVTNICPGEVDTPILASRPQPTTPEQLAKMLKPEDVAAAVLFVAGLPPRAHVPELIIKPAAHVFL